VGKAVNLRRRLASYYRHQGRDAKTRQLVARVREIEVILVNNEVESLVLESNLIRRYQPHYNVFLKGRRNGYHYIVLTGEPVARFLPYRKNRINKPLERIAGEAIARRFGPYVGRRYRDALLDFAADSFQLRTCERIPDKVCLRYHMRRCGGICEARISPDAYRAAIERAVAFLSRGHRNLIERMKGRMWKHAERLEFEQAQKALDRIRILESALAPQVVERDLDHDQHVVYFGEHKALVAEVRRGAILGLRVFDLDHTQAHAEACRCFLLSRYARNSPRELIVNQLEDPDQVEEQLIAANRYGVQITLPERGIKRELVQLCERNYDYRVR
jgi:excinuclease ABC subunit C